MKTLSLQLPIITKWILICLLIGIFSGLASALFLVSLAWVSNFRDNHFWMIGLLPLGGLTIGLIYYYYGASVVKGNNLLFEEYYNPQKKIPFKMVPMVLLGTLLTHLFGGSAGREGTAVQMGAAIADSFSFFKINDSDRKLVLMMGISAGFASVFGTPWAGAVFVIELFLWKKLNLKSILLSFLVAFISNYTVVLLNVSHTHYTISAVPQIDIESIGWVLISGVLFGLTAMLFSRSSHFWDRLFSRFISHPPYRPLVGGAILAVLFFVFPFQKFIGLGVSHIVNAFTQPSNHYDFLLKIAFTSFTLGSGFKGGEVTPLFFIGATLGSALSMFIPIDIALLAGMGFVAVFAGATHTPIACTIMGIELFGSTYGFQLGLACTTAYFFSGNIGIYKSQQILGPKHKLYQLIKSYKKGLNPSV